jgi:hypothetical protein
MMVRVIAQTRRVSQRLVRVRCRINPPCTRNNDNSPVHSVETIPQKLKEDVGPRRKPRSHPVRVLQRFPPKRVTPRLHPIYTEAGAVTPTRTDRRDVLSRPILEDLKLGRVVHCSA